MNGRAAAPRVAGPTAGRIATRLCARICTRLRALRAEESGQVLPVVVAMLLVLCGMTGLALDTGRAMYSQRELQAANDAAALAGAQNLPTAAALTTAASYSAVNGNLNAYKNLVNVQMVSGYPKFECLQNIAGEGSYCTGNPTVNNANALQVKEQASVPLYFGALFGIKNWTVVATSTAIRTPSMTPYNIAVLMDLTLSMNSQDADCGKTQIQCAQAGLQILLQGLAPCPPSSSACTFTNGGAANSIDRVSLFTFPQQQQSAMANNYNCGSSPGAANVYSFPGAGNSSYSSNGDGNGNSYQITGFMSDYKTSTGASSLNQNSALAAAAGGVSNCSGMTPPQYAGYVGTYYAATIYAAQSALAAEKAANPGSQNIMIILSDGDSTAPQTNPPGTPVQNCKYPNCIVVMPGTTASGTYPSYTGECGQAITAARSATSAGTRVYAIAYGSGPTGCASDQGAGAYPNVSPCDTMAQMASAPQYFYSDYRQTGSGSTCIASQPAVSLSNIFSSITGNLSSTRLIPDNTT